MNKYSSQNPFLTKIIKREVISKQEKDTFLIILDIKNFEDAFLPGDSIAIIAENSEKNVKKTIKYMRANEDEIVKNPKTGEKVSLYKFLKESANLSKIKTSLIELLDKNLPQKKVIELINSYHIWDLLKKFKNHNLTAQQIIDVMLPMLPKLYSVSSARSMYPNEAHLLIREVKYVLNNVQRRGVATEFLCKGAKVNKTLIKIYIQETSSFCLPKERDLPIIMIGAGAGLAPFRAFLEERYINNHEGLNWLFFGERKRENDFYFKNFLEDLETKNLLRLTLAFSRDQEEKIYVQDRMYENRSDIWQWLQEKAIIYVCGSSNLGKEVDNKLLEIFKSEGNLSFEEAKNFLLLLLKEKRYLKDVY